MSVRGEKRHLRSGSGVPPEHTSGGARFKTAVGHCVTSVLMVAEASGTLGCIMRWSWISVLFCLMAAAAVGGLLCARDLHVRFWLGEVPELSLASLAVAVGLTLFIVCYRVWVLSYRGHPRLGARKATSDAPCLLSLRTLRTICFLLAFAACSAFGLGVVTIRFGQDMSNVLITRCGHSGATRSMEQVHQELVVPQGPRGPYQNCRPVPRLRRCVSAPGTLRHIPQAPGDAEWLHWFLQARHWAPLHQLCGAFFVAFGTALLLYEDL